MKVLVTTSTVLGNLSVDFRHSTVHISVFLPHRSFYPIQEKKTRQSWNLSSL